MKIAIDYVLIEDNINVGISNFRQDILDIPKNIDVLKVVKNFEYGKSIKIINFFIVPDCTK